MLVEIEKQRESVTRGESERDREKEGKNVKENEGGEGVRENNISHASFYILIWKLKYNAFFKYEYEMWIHISTENKSKTSMTIFEVLKRLWEAIHISYLQPGAYGLKHFCIHSGHSF